MVWVVSSATRLDFTPEKHNVPNLQEGGRHQGTSGEPENFFHTGIFSRTSQPGLNRYTDWATRPTHIYRYIYLYICVYIRLYACVCVRECVWSYFSTTVSLFNFHFIISTPTTQRAKWISTLFTNRLRSMVAITCFYLNRWRKGKQITVCVMLTPP
jgi:hypothetical protein